MLPNSESDWKKIFYFSNFLFFSTIINNKNNMKCVNTYIKAWGEKSTFGYDIIFFGGSTVSTSPLLVKRFEFTQIRVHAKKRNFEGVWMCVYVRTHFWFVVVKFVYVSLSYFYGLRPHFFLHSKISRAARMRALVWPFFFKISASIAQSIIEQTIINRCLFFSEIRKFVTKRKGKKFLRRERYR